MQKEKWINVEGYESIYQISNYGRMKRLDSNKIIKPTKCTNGYLSYNLWKDGVRKSILSHRLVALHFIENPDNLPQINHKNEIITDNRACNLEWCTCKYNANYGNRNLKCRNANKDKFKRIGKYSLDGTLIDTYECISDGAKSVNGDSTLISKVAKGKGKTAYNYIWKFI